jgi:hypothetical protein
MPPDVGPSSRTGMSCCVRSVPTRRLEVEQRLVGDSLQGSRRLGICSKAMLQDACEMQATDRKSRLAGCRMSRCGAVVRRDWCVGGRVSAYCGTTNARGRCDMDHGRRSGISCSTRFTLELHGIIRGFGGGQEGLSVSPHAAWLMSWAIHVCGLDERRILVVLAEQGDAGRGSFQACSLFPS